MTAPKNVFPVRYYASDYGNGSVISTPFARKVWNRIRSSVKDGTLFLNDKDTHDKVKYGSWFCTDMTVHSPTKITIYVYDMADNFHGGIGELLFKLEWSQFTKEEETELKDLVLKIYTKYAEEDLIRIEEEKWQLKVNQHRKNLFPEY